MMSEYLRLLYFLDDTNYYWTTTPQHVLVHVLVAGAVTLTVTFGLFYLFYPAIIVAAQRTDPHKNTVHVECITKTTSTTTTTSTTSSSSSSQQQQQQQGEQHPNVVLSIVIPSYNEELRLPVMLQEAYAYLSSSSSSSSSTTMTQPQQQQQQQQQQEQLTLLPPKALEYLMQASTHHTTTADDHHHQKKKKIDCTKTATVAIEWIVVDDGSTDETGQAFRDFGQQQQRRQQQQQQYQHDENNNNDNNNNNSNKSHTQSQPPSRKTAVVVVVQHVWKLVTLSRNSGKGAAVRAGMLTAGGAFCLMADADGATSFGAGLESIAKELLLQQKQNQSTTTTTAAAAATAVPTTTTTTVWLGSRADLHRNHNNCNQQTQQQQQEPIVERSLVRKFISAAFHKLRAFTLGGKEIADTQCGFKLFPAAAAQSIFRVLHLRRWAFDIEVVYLALHLNYCVREVVVPWHEVEGSKLSTSPLGLALVSLSMLRDMICVRLCYSLGIWTVGPHDRKRRV